MIGKMSRKARSVTKGRKASGSVIVTSQKMSNWRKAAWVILGLCAVYFVLKFVKVI